MAQGIPNFHRMFSMLGRGGTRFAIAGAGVGFCFTLVGVGMGCRFSRVATVGVVLYKVSIKPDLSNSLTKVRSSIFPDPNVGNSYLSVENRHAGFVNCPSPQFQYSLVCLTLFIMRLL